MKNNMNQGQKANFNGRIFHEGLCKTLEKKGFLLQDPPGYKSLWHGKQLNKTDIFIPERNIQIECKYQSVAGTCDQKTFAEIWNAHKKVECDYYVLLLEGPHWKENQRGVNIFKEAKKMADELNSTSSFHGAKKILVMDEDELLEWL